MMAMPYDAIVRGNVFRLVPPPTKPIETPRLPQRITLVGIATILERKVAILNIRPADSAANAAGNRSIVLKEGDADGEVRLIRIDEEQNGVTIGLDGQSRLLNFFSPTTR
jgi:hypothetical protein